jgi:hypothetical protein
MYFLSSCSVQKRVYCDGYTIQWNHKKNDIKQNEIVKEDAAAPEQIQDNAVAQQEETAPVKAVDEKPATASAEAPVSVMPPVKKKSLKDRLIKEDTPEDIMRIQSGSKAAAFKSGFKSGLKMMMPDAEGHTNRLAIASFVLGLLSLFTYYGAFVLGVLAIIFGLIAIHKIRKGEGTKGSTFAWIGLICGIVGVILATYLIQVL